MIICHAHKFIFIKTRKTAGTSIEGALAQICGPEDVITSDGDPATQRDFYIEEARNYAGRFNPLRELGQQRRPIGVARVLRDWARRPRFYNHMSAASVMARIDPAVWQGYYKFCFDRNPWDKTVSFYYFVHRGRTPEVSISDYILTKPALATTDQHYPTDWSRYTLHDWIIVDDVFDFADLASGLTRALAAAGVPDDVAEGLEIPRLKSDTRKGAGTMSQAAADRVGEVFAREISHFGHTPPAHLISGPA